MKPTNNPNELSCWVLSANVPGVGDITRVGFAVDKPTAEDRNARPSSYFKDLKKPEWDALCATLKTNPTAIRVDGPFEVPEAQVAMTFDQMPPEPTSCFSNVPCNVTMLGPITDEDILESDPDTMVITLDQQRYASTLVSAVVDVGFVEAIINNPSPVDIDSVDYEESDDEDSGGDE